MPIYEFSCPKCRVIFSFLSKRVNPERLPVCPRCGNRKMEKQLSAFAMLKGSKEAGAEGADGASGLEPGAGPGGEALDDPRVMRAMAEIERDMDHLDENNPRHMAQVMRKMQQALPPGTMPKDLDVAIRRLEQGEDPERIEADMGDVLGAALGEAGEGMDGTDGVGGPGGGGSYTRDTGLYDY